jgi:Flp pilus assembly protein TadD
LRRATALPASPPEAPFTLGVLLWQTGRGAEAEPWFREAVARRPESADAHYMLATVLRQTGKPDEALTELRAAIGLRADLIEAHQSLAQLLTQRGDEEGARRAQAEADRLTRRKADAQASAFALSVGRQKLKNGDRAGAIAQFREALRLADDNADAHYALAQALTQAGAVAEARKHFEMAKKLAPHAPSSESGK